jgi:hypothetical protein
MDPQMKLGEVDVSQITFDERSRDDIPKILKGLQRIYIDPLARAEVFAILEGMIPAGVNRRNGRPGMDLWRILVLGSVRLCCGFDYDRLHDQANNHLKLREMLGHEWMDMTVQYSLKTIKNNVALLTPEVLEKVNDVVVRLGHKELGKKKDEALQGRADSYVVKTNVHYPTDANLLLDAIRKMIEEISLIEEIEGWRQGEHHIKTMRKLLRRIENAKRGASKSERKNAQGEKALKKKHKKYLDTAKELADRARAGLDALSAADKIERAFAIKQVEEYVAHARRQMDQIHRRIFEGESIPHSEKVFSIFQPHTEWIVKGKAGVAQELGLNVCVLEDQYGFLLRHIVMQNQTDVDVAVSITAAAKAAFPELNCCSYDRGFYSPENKKELAALLDTVIMPRKGRPAPEESEAAFVRCRHAHAAVESAINALESHGLDRCPDSGIEGFKRYAAMAVLGRNLHKLGGIMLEKEHKREKRKKRYRATRAANKRAAA